MEETKQPTLSISQFYLGNILGQGSFSRVHYAKSKTQRQNASECEHTTSCTYALKIIHKRSSLARRNMEYIMNEKNILSSSDVIHKNVVTLFATFMDETNLYFLMELCTSTLADVICRIHEQETSNDPLLSNARFIRQCAVYYFLQLLSGMEHLHGRNIIHRDLKPDNVLLTQTNCIKIADFGFATFQEVTVNSSSSRISSENTHTIFVGSPDYCCPEALNGSAVSTNMFDLWSFGCIYSMNF